MCSVEIGAIWTRDMFNINTFSTNNGHHSVQLPVL